MTDTITPTLKPDSGQLAYAWQVIRRCNLSETIDADKLQQIAQAVAVLDSVGLQLHGVLGEASRAAQAQGHEYEAGNLRAWQSVLELATAQRKEARPVLLPGENSEEIKKVYSDKK